MIHIPHFAWQAAHSWQGTTHLPRLPHHTTTRRQRHCTNGWGSGHIGDESVLQGNSLLPIGMFFIKVLSSGSFNTMQLTIRFSNVRARINV